MGDIKSTWKAINSIIRKQTDKTTICSFFTYELQGRTSTDPSETASWLCPFFTNIGNECAAWIPQSTKCHNEYMPERVKECLFLTPTDEFEMLGL